MKRFSFLYLFIIMAFSLVNKSSGYADRVNIERIRVAQSDLSARTSSVKDLNGTNCALIKMYIPIPNVRFQGNIVKIEENNSGEYWVYMTEGSRELRVSVPKNMPIDINFLNTDVGTPLRSGMVYEIYFSVEELNTIMSISSFNRTMAQRTTLIKDGKYNEAIESLEALKDSLKDIGESQYLGSVDSCINECKRRLTLEKTGFKKDGVLTEGMLMIVKEYKNEKGFYMGLIGFMDSVGNIVVEPKYHRGFDYNKGVAWVSKDRRWGCLDKKGAIKIPLEYKVVKPIKHNHKVNWMEVSVDSIHYGIVDYATGRQVLPMKYEDTSGNESPDDNPLVGLYDPSHKKTYFYNKRDFSPEFSIGNRQKVEWYLDHGLFLTSKVKGVGKDLYGKYKRKLYGIVDFQGRQVLECENYIEVVKDLEKFFDGNSDDFVKMKCPPSKNWDDWKIPAYRIYSLKDREFIEDAEDKYLYTEVSGKWKDWFIVGRLHDYTIYTYYGMVNFKTGAKVFDPYCRGNCNPYNKAPQPVNEGENLILECTGGKWYLFNNEGELIELPKNEEGYHYNHFRQGYAVLKKDGKYGFVDSYGKIVVNPIYDNAYYDYKSDSWKLKNGDEIISMENLIDTGD